MITDDGYKRLLHFLIWCIVGCIIAIIGISNVFAETITDMTFSQFRTTISTYGITSNQYIYDTTSAVPVQMDASANGFSWEWITNYNTNCSGQTVISGQLAIPNDNLNFDWLDDNIKSIYYVPFVGYTGNSTPCTWSVNSSNNIVTFTCSTAEPHNNFIIGGTLQYRPNSNFNTYFRIYRSFNITCDNSASAIIDNQSQNTQNIINNNNSNTDKIIESNKVCTDDIINKDDIVTDNVFLSSSGSLYSINDYGITDYIKIGTLEIVDIFNYTYASPSLCFYSETKSLISCVSISTLGTGTISIPNNAYYFRSSIYKVTNVPTFKNTICENGNQAAEKTRKGILSKIKELFNFFNNDDDADVSGLNNMAGWLPPGPLDSIINLPLNLFNALVNTLSGTCSAVTLTLPFVGQILTLPCFDTFMTQYLTGFNTIWTFIGVTVSIFILYNYLLTLYKWVDDTLTLRENNLPGYYDDNWGGGA